MLKTIILFLTFITPAKAEEAPQAVITLKVQESQPAESITGVGTFTAYNDVVLKAETAGRVETVHFKEGDHVKPNQKLFSLYNKEQEAILKKAEAALKLSQNVLNRKQELFKKNFVSHQDLEKAEAQVKIDEAEFSLAKESLAKTKVLAPFDGVLSRRKVSKGACVKEGDVLARLQDLTPIRFVFHVPQKDIPFIKIGSKVVATTDVYPSQTFDGEVEAIEPSVDEESRSVAVYATFYNKEARLIPGLYGHVQLTIASKGKPNLFIPEQALVIRSEGSYVYKKEGSKAVLTKVTLGKRVADQAEVLSGLKKGDEIVLEGQDKIQDGAGITTQTHS